MIKKNDFEYFYDYKNRLISIKKDEIEKVKYSYTYDNHRILVEKEDGSSETNINGLMQINSSSDIEIDSTYIKYFYFPLVKRSAR